MGGDYTGISNPFDNNLLRQADTALTAGATAEDMQQQSDYGADTSSAGYGGGLNEGGSVETTAVKSAGAIADAWITSFIRSANWSPKNTGFYLDGQTGYAEFANVYITGAITVITGGSIGGFTIGSDYIRDTANSFGLASTATSDADVRFWAGSTFANRATAPARVYDNGAAVFKNLTIDQTYISIGPTENMLDAIQTLTDLGGGVLNLLLGTHTPGDNVVVPSNVQIVGSGAGTIVDFDNQSNHFVISGTNPYTTGTVAVTTGTTSVVGTGTAWTTERIGQSILLKDFWYSITGVADATHLTIGAAYSESTLSGAAYAIADTINNVVLRNFTIQNSTVELVKASYFNAVTLDSIVLSGGGTALSLNYGSVPSLLNVSTDSCTKGMYMVLAQIGTLFNCYLSNITGGDAFNVDGMNNWTLLSFTVNAVTGNGMTLKNVSNTGITVFSIDQCTGKGMEFVSGNTGAIGLENGFINGSGSDGMKFTATTSGVQVSVCTITNNAGYGVNIVNAGSSKNIFGLNLFETNTSGNMNDAGTGTVIRGNSGVADN